MALRSDLRKASWYEKSQEGIDEMEEWRKKKMKNWERMDVTERDAKANIVLERIVEEFEERKNACSEVSYVVVSKKS